MRILMVCNRIPWPLNEGGNLAIWNLATSLQDMGHPTDLICINTLKHFVQPESVPKRIHSLHSTVVDTSIRAHRMALNIFSPVPYIASRFISEDFRNLLSRVLQQTPYDLIQFEGVYTTPYAETIRSNSKAPLVLRAHNVEYKIWERLAAQETNPLRQVYLKGMSRSLKRYEQERMKEMDGVLFFTREDQQLAAELGWKGREAVIPSGTALPDIQKPASRIPHSLGFIGSMDWQPNVDAVRWFLKEIFPSIRREIPEARFYLAGRNVSATHLEGVPADGVELAGSVPDAFAFMRSLEVFVVPLRSGGGMRLKILEAMACESCILSTPTGAEGIGGEAGTHYAIQADADNLAREAVNLLRQPVLRETYGKAARLLAEERYSWPAITRKTLTFYESLL